MYFNIFDTETTGLGSSDEVVQFSSILVRTLTAEEITSGKNENSYLKPVKFYNFYCATAKKSCEKALQVHGLTQEILAELSNGETFEDNFIPMVAQIDAYKPCWVSYNIKFDTRLVNQTLTNNGLKPYNFGKKLSVIHDMNAVSNFCLLDALTVLSGKRRSLSQQLQTIMSEEQLTTTFNKFARYCRIDPEQSYHNAIFDTFCAYLLFDKYYIRLRG